MKSKVVKSSQVCATAMCVQCSCSGDCYEYDIDGDRICNEDDDCDTDPNNPNVNQDPTSEFYGLDECLVCNGSGAIYDCGCTGIPDEACDCYGNVDSGCGCGEAGPSGCDNECGSTAELDECGVCDGDGIVVGTCDCDGNVDSGCGWGEAGPSGCDNECVSNQDFDECGE